MNNGKGRGTGRTTGEPRGKTKRSASQSVARALLRRQALGRRGRLPSSHGLPKAPARLVYSMANVIPVGQRHDRVVLGFTADGEHLVCCCGPVANPSRLELRRVRLQWPGLSRPGEAVWSLPLKIRGRGDNYPFDRGHASHGAANDGTMQEEEGEEEEEEDDEHGLGMDGMGGQLPASVTVTESADGFIVVVVVSPRHPPSELREVEEDRVCRVFVAPGPAYVSAVRDACVERPFSGVTFSYIVPAGGDQGGGGVGGAPVPSIAAHDVGAVGGAGGRAREARVYMIVVNAVDVIRAVEVRLHTDDTRAPLPSPAHVSTTTECSPVPPGTKLTLRPPAPPRQSTKNSFDGGGGGRSGGRGGGRGSGGGKGSSSSGESESGGGGDDRGGGSRGQGARGDGGVDLGNGPSGGGGGSHTSCSCSTSGGGSSFDPSLVWWACGRDLPSSPLLTTRALPCCRRSATGGGGVAATAREEAAVAAAAEAEAAEREAQGRAARGGGVAVIAEPALVLGRSTESSGEGEGAVEGYGSSSTRRGCGESAAGGGGRGGGEGVAGAGGQPAAPAVPSQAAQRPPSAATAAPARRRRGRSRSAYATAERGRQRVLDLEVFISQLLLRREAFPGFSGARQPPPTTCTPTPEPIPTPGRKRKSTGGCCSSPGGGASAQLAPPPPVLATDYHCVTVGLMDGGRRVLLCLVVEVVYPARRNGAGGRGGAAAAAGYRHGAPRAGDGGGGGGADAGAGVLGFVLALDLECGEVAVLETRSGPARGRRCAPLCEALARSVRRGGAFVVDRPGRRLSNANVIQGRSLGAIVNPVYPMAIVMGVRDPGP
eukprot:g1510.t1